MIRKVWGKNGEKRGQGSIGVQMAEQVGRSEGIECWQVADATSFMVRGTDYNSTKKKVHSIGSIYRHLLPPVPVPWPLQTMSCPHPIS